MKYTWRTRKIDWISVFNIGKIALHQIEHNTSNIMTESDYFIHGQLCTYSC